MPVPHPLASTNAAPMLAPALTSHYAPHASVLCAAPFPSTLCDVPHASTVRDTPHVDSMAYTHSPFDLPLPFRNRSHFSFRYPHGRDPQRRGLGPQPPCCCPACSAVSTPAVPRQDTRLFVPVTLDGVGVRAAVDSSLLDSGAINTAVDYDFAVKAKFDVEPLAPGQLDLRSATKHPLDVVGLIQVMVGISANPP